MTNLIDGKAFAEDLLQRIADATAALKNQHRITPGLAVILVGNDPASEVYVRNKKSRTIAVGMNSFDCHLSADVTQDALIEVIKEFNHDPEVHGILVQLPLPKHINEQTIINTIHPSKDVDGFHVINSGKLAVGQQDALVSCTPLGCLMLLKHRLGNLSGKHAVVVGRSNIVGKPMAQLLLQENCTVTVCHSHTRHIESIVKQGDIVVAAVGKAEMVTAGWIKPGAVVIDVGINRVTRADGTTKLVGDVAFHEVKDIASAITPVPGGVGPMTIACLLRNTLQAACSIHHTPFPL